jgi:hypothetical protein
LLSMEGGGGEEDKKEEEGLMEGECTCFFA